jgi:hypothetical protein
MRDVMGDKRQQLPKRTLDNRSMECTVAYNCPDRQKIAIDGQPIEAFDLVDVDQMSRPGHPKCHDRHQALATRQDTAIERREFSEGINYLFGRPRDVPNE